MDLERSDTFSLERAETFTDYNQMTDVFGVPRGAAVGMNGGATDEVDLGILDEERVHWRVLAARIFCFFLLFLILLCCSLEQVSPKFLILAVLMSVLLVFVIIATYIDVISRIRSCCHMLTFTAARPPPNTVPSEFIHSRGSMPQAIGAQPAKVIPGTNNSVSRETFSPMLI